MVRKSLIISYILLLLTFSAPLLYSLVSRQLPDKEPEPEAQTRLVREASEMVTVLHEGEIMHMDRLSYLVGVVAAEMPAAFPSEALKAQAVAARTYTEYCAAACRHSQAQICTNSGCCQAWMGEETLRERWGADYEKYHAIILSAVRDTAGQRLDYMGQPVFAAFHSSSPGATESSGQIWNETPYLVSVYSPETPERMPELISYVRVAALDFRDTLLSAYPEMDLSGPEESWIAETVHCESGRVDSIRIGGVEVPGTRLRQLFSLRSTAFEIDYDGMDFVFTVAGFGHGVGMSQYGAKLLAEEGLDYTAILAHYYPGTSLVS